MSSDRDVTRIVRSWLDEGVTQLPDRVLDAVLDQVPATPQRRAWWPARRFPIMNSNTFRLGIAAAAAIVIALVGVSLLIPRNVGNPTESATPTAIPDGPTAAATILPAHFGPLDPGTYLVTDIDPSFTFTVPAGWGMGTAFRDGVTLSPLALETTGAGILVCRDTAAVDAANNVVVGIGTDASSIVSHVAERTDLRNQTEPQADTIGGLDGWYVDFDGPERPDPDTVGDVTVVGPACGINAYDQQVTRLGVFDIPGGGNVLIVIYSPPGDRSVIDVGTSIVETFVFDVPG